MTSINGPLHPSVRPHLDPEYVEFYESYLVSGPALHLLPWDPACRSIIAPGELEPCQVGSVKDIVMTLGGREPVQARIFTPEGTQPEDGWPVLVYYHGGGWVLGDINTENSFCARTCTTARCVVVTVDYRLAPEHPFPAAVDDSWTALEWIYELGKIELGIDPNKIAVGGSSAGGNLSAVLTQRAAQRVPPLPIVYQVLIVPVTDNTASPHDGSSPLPAQYDSWVECKNTPGLSPGRMMWFRNHYLPDEVSRCHPNASPIYQPDDSVWKALPDAWVGVAEFDILKSEGQLYAQKLREAGKKVDFVVYPASPHPIMAMDGALKKGFQVGEDAAKALKRAFYGSGE